MNRPASRMAAAPLVVALVVAILVAVLAGAVLRFDALGEPSYWLDEILGDLVAANAAAQPWWHWITGVHPEHGPLYYGLQLAARTLGTDEASGRLPAAVFGLLTIPLIAWIARAAGDRSIAGPAVCALLLATSPLHVYYSREARPYGLLLFLVAVMLAGLLRGSPAMAIVALAAALDTSIASAPAIAAVFVAAACASLLARDRRRDGTIAAAALACLALVPLLYRHAGVAPSSDQVVVYDATLVAKVLRVWTVSALATPEHARITILLAAFAVVGAIAMIRDDRRAAAIVLSMTLVPTFVSIPVLWMSGHFFASRYVAASLIGFLVLAGRGVVQCVEWATRWITARWSTAGRVVATVLALAIASGVSAVVWKTARREPFQKLDWRSIAASLRERVQPGDVIATAQAYSYLSLRYYLHDLRDLPPGVDFVRVDSIPVADHWSRKRPAAWLVTSGVANETSGWLCRFPLLLASPLEDFRLHFTPSLGSFLNNRSTAAERRAADAALGARGLTLQMGPNDEFWLGMGWAGVEGIARETFRWARGHRATINVPRGAPRDRRIRFRTYPITDASLPPQTLQVTMNGVDLASLTLASEWREYVVQAPARLWSEGMNEVSFAFSRANRPSTLDPRSTDTRELAAAFDWIAIDDAGAPPSDPAGERPPFAIRLGADSFLDAKTAWRDTPTRLPPSRLRAEPVKALLARLGYDPLTTWPQIERGDVDLDDVAQTLAYGSCDDPEGFTERVFEILLERTPSDIERRGLRGLSRVAAVDRMVQSDEFRAKVLRPSPPSGNHPW